MLLTTKTTSNSLRVRHWARLARVVGVVLLSLGVALTIMGKAQAGVSGTNGTMTITQQDGQTAMNSGGSQATFYLNLSNSPGKPAADCSADSATGSTFVYSYAVHQSVDPSTLSFASGHPAGTGATYGTTAFGLFQSPNGGYYGGQTTAVGTGQVQTNSVGFQWNPPLGSTKASALLFNGGGSSAWNVGIACWNSGTSAITDIWNSVVTFGPSSSDPAGYTWTANPSSTSTSTTTSTTTTSSSSTTTPTTTSSTTTPTTTPGSQGTATSSDTTTTVSTLGSGSGDSAGTGVASGNAGSGATSSGSSTSLPLTGAPVRLELNIGIGTLWLGFAVLLVSVVLPRKTSRSPSASI